MVNYFNQKAEIVRLGKKERFNHVSSIRDTSYIQRQNRRKVKGWKKDMPCKQ